MPWTLFPLRNTRMLILVMGLINFTIVVYVTVQSTVSQSSYFRLVAGGAETMYSNYSLHVSTARSSVVVAKEGTGHGLNISAIKAKLEKIVQDLNVSASNTSDTMYPSNVIGDYVLINRNLCRGADVIEFIIIVHTAPAHFDRRKRIRESFAKESLFMPFHVRVAFLLGRSRNQTLEELLRSEHAAHGDSVMGNFIDDYHNLTLKGVMGYHWVSQYCNNSKFVLKIDDDVIVNMFKLLYSFYGHMSQNRSIFCNFWWPNTMSIMRDGKWQVQRHIFPKHKAFPYNYCSGFVVIITTDLVGPMYQAAKVTPFFWIDDVYLFGMLPYVVGGVRFHNYALDRNLSLSAEKTTKCLQREGFRCPIVASLVDDQSHWSLWEIILGMYAGSSWNMPIEFVV